MPKAHSYPMCTNRINSMRLRFNRAIFVNAVTNDITSVHQHSLHIEMAARFPHVYSLGAAPMKL